MNDRAILTLAELEAFDSHSPLRTSQRRFLCPLCGQGKPKDAAHRSLGVRVADGVWNCQRCKAKGQLREHWPEKSFERSSGTLELRRQRMARTLSRAFEVDASSWNIPTATSTVRGDAALDVDFQAENPPWKAIWADSAALEGTPGAAYLVKRGLGPEIAQRAGLRFHRSWNGRETVVFPFRKLSGEVVAVSGRALRDGGMDKPALGPKSSGAFLAPCRLYRPLDIALPWILICEAPLDALSLASCGFAALAVGGTSVPAWLIEELSFRRVALAFDNDEAGEEAAARCGRALATRGAVGRRLLPPQGFKDWNAALIEYGQDELDAWLMHAFCAHQFRIG